MWFNINFFLYSKRLLHQKEYLKGNYYLAFEGNCLSYFLRHTLPKTEIGLPNFNFRDFFFNKQQLYSKKMQMYVYISSFKKNIRAVFEILAYGVIFGSPFPNFTHFNFFENLEILSMHLFDTVHKIQHFYIYQFLEI